eukprot:s258_g17.t1
MLIHTEQVPSDLSVSCRSEETGGKCRLLLRVASVQELQDHHQQQASLQQQHAVQRQQHQEELAAQQARYMQTQAQLHTSSAPAAGVPDLAVAACWLYTDPEEESITPRQPQCRTLRSWVRMVRCHHIRAAGCAALAANFTVRRDVASCDGWHPGYNWSSDARPLVAPRWPGTGNKSEPVYCRKDVQQHDGRTGSVWVTYRDGVYDVTEYLEKHPGGKLILQAAGGPVDEWWKYWAQHHLSPDVAAALEALRVGRLLDYQEEEDQERYGRGVWEPEQTAPGREESRRTGAILSELPFQTETCVSELSAEFLTPKGKLYVRNHAPVPAIETSTDHMITFVSQQEEELDLTLGQLQERFPRHRITSILQCTGNRAADNIAANGYGTSGFVGGDSEYIGAGMLGNASWSGYRLDDVLGTLFPSLSTLSAEAIQELHLTLEGVDGYYTSIPLSIALEKSADCLLATHMNGEELTPDHGFPVRALLPGIAGARNVKWLAKVAIGKESDSPWTAHYYRTAGRSAPIYALPLNSVILSPEPGAWLHESKSAVAVKGVAYAGGGQHPIQSVELSADRGQSWQTATCHFEEVPDDDCQGPSRSWVRFESVVELPPSGSGARGSGKTSGAPLTELWCRAIDKAGNIQPESSLPQGGYMYNGYHRVPLVRSLKLPVAMPATVYAAPMTSSFAVATPPVPPMSYQPYQVSPMPATTVTATAAQAPLVTKVPEAPMAPQEPLVMGSAVQHMPTYPDLLNPAQGYAPVTGAVGGGLQAASTCGNCGSTFLPDALFCRKCGTRRGQV